MATTQADWRRWAIQIILFNRAGPMRTKDILHEIEKQEWDVLPTNGRMDAVHAACVRLSRHVFADSDLGVLVSRTSERPIFWELTWYGREFTGRHLVDNPNITPEKSREK